MPSSRSPFRSSERRRYPSAAYSCLQRTVSSHDDVKQRAARTFTLQHRAAQCSAEQSRRNSLLPQHLHVREPPPLAQARQHRVHGAVRHGERDELPLPRGDAHKGPPVPQRERRQPPLVAGQRALEQQRQTQVLSQGIERLCGSTATVPTVTDDASEQVARNAAERTFR